MVGVRDSAQRSVLQNVDVVQRHLEVRRPLRCSQHDVRRDCAIRSSYGLDGPFQ